MKKFITIGIFMILLSACSSTSSNFVNVSLPNFKPQVPTKIEPIQSNVKISLEPINIEQNNNYSDYFENSVLKLRIEKEIDLLKENLEEQIKTIALLAGYEIDDKQPDYKLKTTISIYIEEKEIQKTNELLSGDFINSKLGMAFKANAEFINIYDPQNKTNMTSNTKLDSLISLTYPIKSDDGINMFKTSISSVPTQLNKGLERPAFEIDKSFLAFYKNFLNTLYSNLPKALDIGKPSVQNKQEFNEFNAQDFEEKDNKTNHNNTSETSEEKHSQNKNDDGVIIFE
ncbi:hypothetical protein JG677_04430 [Campylobacter sp. TTU-622]|uniref:hypothetical protein n=1 Tax=unclassified Campylobacter TaxID=2593542 RepID=UPI00190399AF|nr:MULTISPECIES: hypothetical protein [unclassified Campylobacter]MBK1972087.1 hypothetical protein [Campylobacter sp. TTU_617]MBK1973296.1 hypothetical protein [Campylobacter sp. TTU-622]